jgi:hypothetical protein
VHKAAAVLRLGMMSSGTSYLPHTPEDITLHDVLSGSAMLWHLV